MKSDWPVMPHEILKSPKSFLSALYGNCGDYRKIACLTLTAIHPDGGHPTPSRHIPLDQPEQLHSAIEKLLRANRLGWGAYFSVGLRRPGLRRYQRGGLAFDPSHGIGRCFGKHGRLLLKDICTVVGIYPADYGGLFI